MIASMRRPFLFPGAQAAADFVYHPFDGVFVEVVDGFGQQVGQLRRRRDEARGIDDDPGVGQLGQALQFLRLVPAKFEITGDLLDQAGPGTAPVPEWAGSGDLAHSSGPCGLLALPVQAEEIPAGTRLRFLPWPS